MKGQAAALKLFSNKSDLRFVISQNIQNTSFKFSEPVNQHAQHKKQSLPLSSDHNAQVPLSLKSIKRQSQRVTENNYS